jgi:perosamine synthetase
MDVSQIESRITSKTKAIMIVHIYGLPVNVDPVLALAKKYGLKVIEDAAEMHGQNYKGRPCGSFGDVSTFSFYPNKLITTGEGGMIVTDDEAV